MSRIVRRPCLDRFLKFGSGPRESAAHHEQGGEVAMGFGKMESGRDGPPDEINARVDVATLTGQNAQKMPGVGIVRARAEDVAINLFGFGVSAGAMMSNPQLQSCVVLHPP